MSIVQELKLIKEEATKLLHFCTIPLKYLNKEAMIEDIIKSIYRCLSKINKFYVIDEKTYENMGYDDINHYRFHEFNDSIGTYSVESSISLTCYFDMGEKSIPYEERLDFPIYKALERCWKYRLTITKISSADIQALNKLYFSITKCASDPRLKILNLKNYVNIKEIGDLKGIDEVFLDSNRLLLKLPDLKCLKRLECRDESPWRQYHIEKYDDEESTENKEYKDNISKLITLQRWFKFKNRESKIKRAIKYTKDPKLFSWFYSPKHRGGKIAKERLKMFLGKVKVEKEGEV